MQVSKKIIGKERKGKEREGKGRKGKERKTNIKSHKVVIFHVCVGAEPLEGSEPNLEHKVRGPT